jgi:hypothetical protein
MIKKILPISVFVLVVVLIILFGIQNLLSQSKSQGVASITPTLFQGKQTSGKAPVSNKTTSTSTSPTGTVEQLSSEELQKKLPIYAPDFTLSYSPRMQRYVATIANDEAAASYADWIAQNPSYESELENTIVTKQTLDELNSALDFAKTQELTPEKKAKADATIFTNTLNTLINLPFLFMQSTGTSGETEVPSPTPASPQTRLPSSSPSTVPTNSQLPATNPSAKLTYYSQCDGPYDEKPLPNGCTVCNAGCGPTSVAMILSSYIDKSLNPIKTIDLMDKAGVRIGCYGSYISEIYSYLKGRGDLKVSDFIIPSEKGLTAKEVIKDFEGYTKSGWTIFVLANFKTDGGGHYFWVTDVNSNGDILAYDPYYGKQQPAPISENRYNPAPYYRYAFAVKKS